ncbi:hypothetical protein HUS85_23790 [Pseudomonas protegens]|nr:hypothetical protein [Pseudomonas protegens]QTU20600.1 hypothetical protein HUT22_21530 [Pseudomonas protegens]
MHYYYVYHAFVPKTLRALKVRSQKYQPLLNLKSYRVPHPPEP